MTDRFKRILIGQIVIGHRLRQISEPHVEVLMDSMRDVGLITPIDVEHAEFSGVDEWHLVTGAHRLEAAKRLGWERIDTVVGEPGNDWKTRLREIDENLIRHELTALDRARFLAERKRLYELLHPPSKGGRPSKNRRQLGDSFAAPRFSADAAERTGLSERAVQRAVRLSKQLAPDAAAILASLPIADSEAELFRLATRTGETQVAAAGMLKGDQLPEPARTVAEAVDLACSPASLARYRRDPSAWREQRKRRQSLSAEAAEAHQRRRQQLGDLRDALEDGQLDPVARVLRAAADLDESQRDILVVSLFGSAAFGGAMDLIERRRGTEPAELPPELIRSAADASKRAKLKLYRKSTCRRRAWQES